MIPLEGMKTPRTRAEFERNMFIHTEQVRKGKHHSPEGFTGGFDEVRNLPNGRLDLLSVNETARLQANMTAHFLNVDFAEMAKAKGIAPTESEVDQRETKIGDEAGETP